MLFRSPSHDIEGVDKDAPWTRYKGQWIFESMSKPSCETVFVAVGEVQGSILEHKVPKYEVKLSKEEIKVAIRSLKDAIINFDEEDKSVKVAVSLCDKLEDLIQ